MSLHGKVVYALTSARSRLVTLKCSIRSDQHVAVLSEMVADIDRMIRVADEVLPLHQSQADRVGRRDNFGLGQLGVGDFVDAPRERAASLRVAASKMGKATGRVFTVRTQNDGRVRCTRLADPAGASEVF